MSVQRLFTLYAIGSLAAVLTLLADWALRKTLGGGLALLAPTPTMAQFYQPMVWGGICAMVLFLLPIRLSWVPRGLIYGIVPGLIELSLRSGGLDGLPDFLKPDKLLRYDVLVVMIAYIVVWGLVSSYMAQRQGGAA